MSDRPYRAWRFLLPRLDVPDDLAGLQLTPTGGVAMVDGDASVRQAVLLLLATRPGERVMRPTYGCDLHRLVFSPIDETTAGLAMHYVRRALDRWEPRIEILRLDAVPNASEPGRLDITLDYRVRRSQRTATLEFPLRLSGETS